MPDDEHGKSGHNIAGLNADLAMKFIERIESGEKRKKEEADYVKDIYVEVKSAGIPPDTMRQVIKRRAMDSNKRDEKDHWFALLCRVAGV